MNVYVFQYVGSYGDGLVFAGENYKHLDFYINNEDYKLFGVFDLPQEFLNALKENFTDEDFVEFVYME